MRLLYVLLFFLSIALIGCSSAPCNHSDCEYTDYLRSVDSLCERYKAEIQKDLVTGDTTDIMCMVNSIEEFREGQKRMRARCLGEDSVWYKWKRFY